MLEEVDERLRAWVEQAAPGVAISFDPPGAVPADGPLASLYLFDLGDVTTRQRGRSRSLEVRVSYLVTASASDPASAHTLIGRLVTSAATTSGIDLDLDIDAGLWSGLGIARRPAFVLRTLWRQDLGDSPAPLVTRVPTVRERDRIRVVGRVLGPGDVAIQGAWVTAEGESKPVRSDGRGRFRIDVPEPRGHSLKLRAEHKGLEATASSRVTRNRKSEELVLRLGEED